MKTKKIVVYGAGAIGRGYVPWLFKETNTKIYFVERDNDLRDKMLNAGKYKTYMTNKSGYECYETVIEGCFSPGEEHVIKYDGAITAVGPRYILNLKDNLKKLDCPVIFFENDSRIPDKLARLEKAKNFFFGIPDVITSNTAPDKLKKDDDLALVTENGTTFADISAKEVGGNINYINSKDLKKQWIAKLYLHNTPHCIAAYLGSLCNFKYIHEGMGKPSIYKVVENAIFEIGKAIINIHTLDNEFVNWYGKKELDRFSNQLLYDPIKRVAREPFRKLGLTNRLIGAAQLCLRAGINPKNIITGIMAAFLYDDINDDDSNIKILMDSLTPDDFLSLIINIQPYEAIYEMIIYDWDSNMKLLNDIKNG